MHKHFLPWPSTNFLNCNGGGAGGGVGEGSTTGSTPGALRKQTKLQGERLADREVGEGEGKGVFDLFL